jgi:hypothetical protein
MVTGEKREIVKDMKSLGVALNRRSKWYTERKQVATALKSAIILLHV